MFKLLFRKINEEPFFLFFLVLFCALLLRNPFSTRTLIPNFEPFPDGFHYIVSARSLIAGHGFRFYREGRSFSPSVPPFYSLSLVPAFLVHNDPRMFYVVNVLFAVAAYYLFTKIAQKLIDKKSVRALLYFFYVSSFYLSWYPQWAMAENLVLPAMLLAVYVLILPLGKWRAVIASALPFVFYYTKFANAPITVMLGVLFVLKYLVIPVVQHTQQKNIVKTFLVSLFFFLFFFTAGDYYLSGRNAFLTAGSFIVSYAHDWFIHTPALSTAEHAAQETGFFSLRYFPSHFAEHWRALNGEKTQVLWDFSPLLPILISIGGLLGLFTAWLVPKLRWIALSLFAILGTEILFMSTFYAVDMRYILFAIPFLILGFGFLLEYLRMTLLVRLPKIFLLLILGLFVGHAVFTAPKLKSQIMLNLKYAETPWWYISVRDTIAYFHVLPPQQQKPVLISAIPPYFFDFFSSGEFELLPLSMDQDFRDHAQEAWGSHDYSNLIQLYDSYLKHGRKVYVMNYGLGHVEQLIQAYDAIGKNFQLIELKSNCYNLCNIYQVTEKSVENKQR